MEKLNEDDDAAYYRQRTVARLIDKRRQIESLELKELELRKAEDMKFRIQWKEGFKKKRGELIASKVDKQILHRIMHEHPGILTQVVSAEKLGLSEAQTDEALADLVDDFDEREVGADNPLMSPNLQAASMLHVPGSKPNHAMQFLQNAATFRLSVNHRLREQSAAQLKAAAEPRGHPAAANDSAAAAPLRRISSAADSDLSIAATAAMEDRSKGLARGTDAASSKVFSSYRSEMQVSKLVMSLLQDPQQASRSPRGDPEGEGRRDSSESSSLLKQFANRSIKTTGMMSKVFRDSSLHRGGRDLLASPLGHATSFSLHRSSVTTFGAATPGAGRTLASSSKRSGGGDAASGASAVAGSAGSVGSDEASRSAAAAASSVAPELAISGNAMFCSLVDGVFLMGPSARSIREQIDLRRDERPSSSAEVPVQSVPDFNTAVPPAVLFSSERSYSAEVFTLLPMYCFPSDVELGVRSAKISSPAAPPGKRRKNSLNLLTAKTVAEAGAGVTKSAKKRNAIFFNSDYALGLSMAGAKEAAGSRADTAPIAAAVDQLALPEVNAGMANRNPFVVMIGDHTNFEYGVCIQLPMVFHLEGGLTVHTSYVLCLMTRLPFFSMLFHALDQFDAYFDGFKFKEPIPTQDLSFPFIPELRPLSDLANKLRRLLVPKYPYIINSALNSALPSSRRRANTTTSTLNASSASAKPDGAAGILSAEYPALDNDQDTKAVLPDVEFSFGAITAPRKVQAMFKRSTYQSYYSSAGMKYDSGNRALNDLIARYDQMVANFVPNSVHRSEKEKEDTYLVMLWALPVLLKHLPLDQIVLALGCAISEMRIIVKHPDLHVVTAVIWALLQLLRPLKWCAPIIVVMPDSLDTLLDSPTFVMIGLQKLPSYFTLLEGFVVIDPLERIVHLNPTDVVESHTILLPHGSKLVNALSTSAETILRCTKKKRSTRHRRSVPSEPEPMESASASAAAGAGAGAVPVELLPLPVDLDTAAYENLQLLAAIKTFMGLVSHHIQAILNTAIQMQQQTKQASRDERRLLIRSISGVKQQKQLKSDKVKPAAVPVPPVIVNAPPTQVFQPTAVIGAPVVGEAAAASDYAFKPAAASTIPVVLTEPLPTAGDTQGVATSTTHDSEGDVKLVQKPHSAADLHPSPRLDPKATKHGEVLRRRQSDITAAGMHSPKESGASSRTATAHLEGAKKSPAGRHSLPPTTKKSPLGRRQEEAEDTEHKYGAKSVNMKDREKEKEKEKDSPTKADFRPAKAKDFADRMKVNAKGPHGAAADKAGRHSMGGTGKHTKDSAAHPPKADVAKGKAVGSIDTSDGDFSPLHTGGTHSTANAFTPRLDELITPMEGTVSASMDAEETIAVEQQQQQQQRLADEVAVSARPALASQVSNRHILGNALVFNIDSLTSPFVIPSPKVIKPQVAPAQNVVGASSVFSNLPEVPHASSTAEEATARDSLHDETCSDITVTDAGGHGGDDGSAGNRARTESSHDSGDRGSDIVGESIASSSSSLPTLKSNAPLLLVKEIGQSGAKFINRIHETQMYSNYCQQIRQQSALAAAKRAAAEKALQEGGAAAARHSLSIDVQDERGMNVVSPNLKAWSHLSLAAEVESALFSGEGSALDEDEPIELDALQEVFSIMLSGTTPLPEQVRKALSEQAEKVYAQSAPVLSEEVRAKLAFYRKEHQDLSSAESSFATAVQRYTKAAGRTIRGRAAQVQIDASPDADPGAGEALWCSGLRCRGLCNTAYCNSICLALWVEKVKALRQLAAFRSIVSKKQQQSSTLLLRAHRSVVAHGPSGEAVTSASQQDKVAVAALLAPKVEVVRHHKETHSQYEQRKGLVESKKLELFRMATSPAAATSSQVVKPEKQRSVYGPAHGDGRTRLYARGGSADPATLSIALYYAERERRCHRRLERRALKVLKPLMLRFVCLYRKYKFFHAIYLIQALIRGLYVRNHIPELVEALIARRIRRLLAVIRIRRYLRQHADQICRRYLRAKMEQQRRRRASISIPVTVKATSMSEKNGGSRRQQEQRTPRKVYSISDDILPSSGINIVGISGVEPFSVAAGVSMEPLNSFKAPPSSRAEVNPLTNEHAAQSSSATPTDAVVAENNTAEAGAARGKEFVAGSENVSGKGTSSAKLPQQRLSTGAYAERVKEYLQYGGKILHRGTSTSIQPNKYAAHYMQKRNSKPGVPGQPGGPGVGPAVAPTAASTAATPAAVAALSADHAAPISVASGTDSEAAGAFNQHFGAKISFEDDKMLSIDEPQSAEEASAAESTQRVTLGDATSAALAAASAAAAMTVSENAMQSDLAAPALRPRIELFITTRFSSSTEDSSSEAGSSASALRTESSHSTPFSATGAAQRVIQSEQQQKQGGEAGQAVVPPEILSPTSGIRMVDAHYEDSDEEAAREREGAGREKANSLVFSEYGGSELDPSSPLSLIDISMMDDSAKHSHSGSSGDVVPADMRVVRSHAARASLGGSTSGYDDDDRASVLSSNSNSTPARRSSAAGSSTDHETSQPMLLAILAHQHVRVNSTNTLLGMASDSTELSNKLLSEVPDDGTVISTRSQSSTRTGRATLRNSLPANFLHDAKKMSPIGRYAAEKSHDKARIFTPRLSGSLSSQVPFQSSSVDGEATGGADISPLRLQQRPGNPAHQSLRTPRLGILSDAAKKARRQTFMVGSSSHSFNRRLGSQDLESISESALSGSEKLTVGPGALARIDTHSRSQRLSGWETHGSGGNFGHMEEPPEEEQHYNWGGSEARRRITLHTSLPRTPLSGQATYSKAAASAQDLPPLPKLSPLDAGMVPREDLVPHAEHLQYAYHQRPKSDSPKSQGGKAHADSPVRSNSECRQAIDQESGARGGEGAEGSTRGSQSDLSRSDAESKRTQFEAAAAAGGEGLLAFREEFEDEDEEPSLKDKLMEAIKVAPLKTLGSNLLDYLNRQQIQMIQDMYTLLRTGVEVLKHSRKGGPAFKKLYCDVNMTKLYWRERGTSRPDAAMDNCPEDASYYPTLADPSASCAALARGVDITVPATSKSGSAPRRTYGAKSNAERVMYIRDITEVREDCESYVLQRSLAKGYVTQGSTYTITIAWEDRTLDFEIVEENWNRLFHALQVLVNFYRTITTTPRGASFSSGRTPPEGSSNFNYLTYDSTGPSQQSATDKSKGNDKEKGSEKKRLSSGLGSMLLNRRSQGLDRDETANLL